MSIVETGRTEARGTVARALAATGLASGLLASSCCLLPLVLLSVGISGAWIAKLTALAPYQPVFLGAAAASLGLGFRRAYRRQDCAVASSCARPGATRTTKAFLWLGVTAVLAALGIDIVAPLIL